MKALILLPLALLVLILTIGDLHMVHAWKRYQAELPNGALVTVSGQLWPGVGHTNRLGGSQTLNAFGKAFKNAGFTWTKTLCEEDSDGDGQSNGLELGDPTCAWTKVKGDAVLSRTTDISHPGLAMSTTAAIGSPSSTGSSGNTAISSEDDNGLLSQGPTAPPAPTIAGGDGFGPGAGLGGGGLGVPIKRGTEATSGEDDAIYYRRGGRTGGTRTGKTQAPKKSTEDDDDDVVYGGTDAVYSGGHGRGGGRGTKTGGRGTQGTGRGDGRSPSSTNPPTSPPRARPTVPPTPPANRPPRPTRGRVKRFSLQMVFNRNIDSIRQANLIKLVAKVLKMTNTSKVTVDSIAPGSTVVRFGVEVEEGSDTYTTEAEIQAAMQNSTSSSEFAAYEPVADSVAVVDADGSESLPDTGAAATQAPEEEDNSTTTIILLIIVLVVTLAIIACVALYCYSQQKKQDRKDAATKLDQKHKTTPSIQSNSAPSNYGSVNSDPTDTDPATHDGHTYQMQPAKEPQYYAQPADQQPQYSPVNNEVHNDGAHHQYGGQGATHAGFSNIAPQPQQNYNHPASQAAVVRHDDIELAEKP